MATYADQETKAEVGDEVQCINANGSHLLYAEKYKVSDVIGCRVNVKVIGEYQEVDAYRFELIRRAPSPAKAEPLVKWPEENKQLMFRDLKIDELFAFADEWQHQIVRRCVGGGKYINVFVGGGAQDCSCYDASGGRAVRRIQFNPANKEAIFIVI